MPEVLKTVSSLEYDLDKENTKWAAIASKNIGQGNISTTELKDILTVTTGYGNIVMDVFEINGLNYSGGGDTYDLRSFIG